MLMNWITALVVQCAVAVIGGFVAGRLLGVRLSWGRWLVALAAGVMAGGTVGWLLVPSQPGTASSTGPMPWARATRSSRRPRAGDVPSAWDTRCG